MSLSDACHDYKIAIEEATAKLALDVDRYGATPHPNDTGKQIAALRQACDAALHTPDLAAPGRLSALTLATLSYLDTPPGAPQFPDAQKRLQDAMEALRVATA